MMTPQEMGHEAERVCQLAPVVPVLVVHDKRDARSLAQALINGGLPALEVTLRTDAALDVIAEMAAVPGGVVGAGTLRTLEDVKAAKAAGASFGVSPGVTPSLIEACIEHELPLLPGAATASEVMVLLERGFRVQKFFPAEANGGVSALASLASPLPQVKFCPTGGVSLSNARQYLDLDNTLCVGGSWVAPKSAIEAGDWDAIEALAREASKLSPAA